MAVVCLVNLENAACLQDIPVQSQDAQHGGRFQGHDYNLATKKSGHYLHCSAPGLWSFATTLLVLDGNYQSCAPLPTLPTQPPLVWVCGTRDCEELPILAAYHVMADLLSSGLRTAILGYTLQLWALSTLQMQYRRALSVTLDIESIGRFLCPYRAEGFLQCIRGRCS